MARFGRTEGNRVDTINGCEGSGEIASESHPEGVARTTDAWRDIGAQCMRLTQEGDYRVERQRPLATRIRSIARRLVNQVRCFMEPILLPNIWDINA
jgi:hypothetical protein